MTEDLEPRLARLMAAAQDGDAAAYRALLTACLPLALAIARRQGVPADRADDVAQEVLMTVHRARATYDPARPFLPWLRAIAQRRAIDALRLHGRRAGRELHHPAAYEAYADRSPTAGELIDQSDRARRLGDAVALLPDGQRQAVELLGLREQSLEAASSQTGRSKGALKVNLHRALKTLRGKLVGGRSDV